MVFFNYALRKLNAKIVYYGPGLCGKTTNLQWIHDHFEGGQRGKMVSLSTEGDRTIFFDLLPLDIGQIRGMEVTLQLYTVPGQVHYNATRQLVLRGADGVVFVADSQSTMRTSNIDSLRNLEENLSLQGVEPESFPHVLQFNKRDLSDLISIEQLDQDVNNYSMPFFEAVATEGVGVQETLEGIVKLVMRSLRERYEPVVAAGPKPPGAEPVPLDVDVPSAVSFGPPPSVIPVSPPVAPPAMAEAPPAPIGMQDDVPTEVYADGRPPVEEEGEGGGPGAAFWDAEEQASGPTFGEDTGFGGDDPTGSENFGFAMPFADNETTTDVTDLETGEGETSVESLEEVHPVDDDGGGAFEEPALDVAASPFEVTDLTPEPFTAHSVFGPAEAESEPVDEPAVEYEMGSPGGQEMKPGTVDDLVASVLGSGDSQPVDEDVPTIGADGPTDGGEDEPYAGPEPETEDGVERAEFDEALEVSEEFEPSEPVGEPVEEPIPVAAEFEAAPETEIVVEGAEEVEDLPGVETDAAGFEAVEEFSGEGGGFDEEPSVEIEEGDVVDAQDERETVAEDDEAVAADQPVDDEPAAASEWDEAHTDEFMLDELTKEAPEVVETEKPAEVGFAAEAEAVEEPSFTGDEGGKAEISVADHGPFTIGEGDPFGDAIDDQPTPVRTPVEPRVAMSAPVADSGDGLVLAGDNQLHLRLQGTGMIAESGQVRALDIEVPVPGSWVGNRRVTLQLRLTLTPVVEEEDGGPGDAP